jgi:hypothetical protein
MADVDDVQIRRLLLRAMADVYEVQIRRLFSEARAMADVDDVQIRHPLLRAMVDVDEVQIRRPSWEASDESFRGVSGDRALGQDGGGAESELDRRVWRVREKGDLENRKLTEYDVELRCQMTRRRREGLPVGGVDAQFQGRSRDVSRLRVRQSALDDGGLAIDLRREDRRSRSQFRDDCEHSLAEMSRCMSIFVGK